MGLRLSGSRYGDSGGYEGRAKTGGHVESARGYPTCIQYQDVLATDHGDEPEGRRNCETNGSRVAIQACNSDSCGIARPQSVDDVRRGGSDPEVLVGDHLD